MGRRATTAKGRKLLEISDEEIAEAIIKARGVIALAARILDVKRTTLVERIKVSPALMRAEREARDETVDLLEGTLLKRALDGDMHALKMALTHYGKERKWFVQDPPENKAPPEVRIVISPYRPPSPEEP